MKKIFVCLSLMFLFSCNEKHDHDHDHADGDGHDHAHGEGEERVGKGKAITYANQKGEIKFSEEALEKLQIELVSFNPNKILIDKKVLVFDKEQIGVYIYRKDRLRFNKIRDLNYVDRNMVTFKVESYRYGDQIATKNVGLIKLSDIFAHDESEYGHSH